MIERVEFDVVVLGGGPAGSACGSRLAQQRARVGIVEVSNFERFRIGETIDGGVQPLLEQLGLRLDGEPPWRLPCRGVGSVWGSPSVSMRPGLASAYGRQWRVDRRAFDRMLLEHAGASGARVFRPARVVSAERQRGRWTLVIETDTDTIVGRTPWVVEATGRTGRSPCSPRGTRIWLDRLVGMALRGRGGPPTARLRGAALVESARCGWWYSVALPSGEMLVVFFTDPDHLPRRRGEARPWFETQLAATDVTRERAAFVREGWSQSSVTVFDARSSICRIATTEGWVAIGDALLACDPLYGRGVLEALGSGIEVADWLRGSPTEGPDDAVPVWVARAARRFNRYVRDRAFIYGREPRWPDAPFWQRRRIVSSDRHHFVEQGLRGHVPTIG